MHSKKAYKNWGYVPRVEFKTIMFISFLPTTTWLDVKASYTKQALTWEFKKPCQISEKEWLPGM